MKNYEKPLVVINEDVAEGIYMASGSNCYTVTARIVQAPELGQDSYCIQMDATHFANHHSGQQIVKINFNQPVTYVTSSAVSVKGDGSSELFLEYAYHANFTESMGLGHLYVKSDMNLTILGITCTYCNEDCGIH